MNLPPVHVCCCNNVCCSSSIINNMNTIQKDNNFCPNHNNDDDDATLQEEQIYAPHPSSKRKRRTSLLACFKQTLATRRHCVNLVCIFSVILLSFVSLGTTSEIPINSSNFLNGESTPASPFGNPADSPSIPTASSSSMNNVVVPGPSSSPAVQAGISQQQPPSVTTQSYFINGYANQIQKTNVTDLRALTRNRRFQLQYRTVCPFGNIINDDKFALRFNSDGYLTYLVLPQEAQSLRSKNIVADGGWHSVTFNENQVYLDDPDSNDRDGISSSSIVWDNSNDNETVNHKLYFFDGFVGCIRLLLPANNSIPSNILDVTQNSNGPTEQEPVVQQLFNGLQKYQPCNDLQFDLKDSAQCFKPEEFVLCSKCENGAKCVFTDGKNECECPDEVEYYPPFCSREQQVNNASLFDIMPESRELHTAGLEDHDDMFVSSTTGSSRSSFIVQSSPLTSSTTEHMTASSSIEQSRVSNDVCSEHPNICGQFGKCFVDSTKELGYECYCRPGFAGDHCSTNFNECLSFPCVNNGTCEDGINTYTCHCMPGYKDKNCQTEINECESSPCENGSTCSDLIADYSCACLDGFAGKNCEINIDECASVPCQNGGICRDLINDYQCDCDDTGFTGINCEVNVDDCQPEMPCQHGGNCTDLIKAYNCSCFLGYNGQNCENDIEECLPDTCKNQGECYERSRQEYYEPNGALENETFDYATAAGYVCKCKIGYEGENCEIDIDECAINTSPCNGHGKCIDEVATFSCQCDKGFEGEFCEIDIDECQPPDQPPPCDKAKECKNLAGDYFCDCNDGYGGKNCSVALTGCITNICFNDGVCIPIFDEPTLTHSFKCTCKSGFTGDTCSIKTTMGFNGSSSAEIVRNDDAYANNKYNLNFYFKTTLPDVVLAVGQGGTYFSLGLSGGKLNLQSSIINSLQGMSSGNNLHDAKWHKVSVSINSSHAILSADIEQVTLPIAEDENIPQQPTGFNVTILGILKQSLGFLNKHDLNPFVGCMQDVKINHERILPEGSENVNTTNIAHVCLRKDQCQNPNPCQNGGTCTDLWQKFTCDCPRPHLGERCNQSYIAATFNHEDSPNSLVTVDIPPGRFGGVFDISMFVRTREPRGTIFLLCDKERGLNGSFIEAAITKSGNLVVQAKWTGSADGADEESPIPESYTVDGLLSDGNPHLISVQRDKNFVVIKVNGSEHFRKSHSNRVFNPTVMYIGGKPAQLTGQDAVSTSGSLQDGHSGETSTSLPDGSIDNNTEGTATDTDGNIDVMVPEQFRFKGTIQDVRINLSAPDPSPTLGHTSHLKTQNVYIVEFFNLTEIHQRRQPLGRVDTQNLREGVVSDDHCKSSPCFKGKCSVTWNDYSCDCYNVKEYDGKQCDIRLRCADVTCPGRSSCKNILHTGFECVADAAFDGKGHTTPHYILKSNSPADLNFNELSFKYRSKRAGNVLHMFNGTSFLRISLETYQNESAVRVHFPNNEKLQLINSTILDGEWHYIEIKFPSPENPSEAITLFYDKLNVTSKFEHHSHHQYLRDLILSPNVDIVVGSSLSIDDYGRPISTEPGHSHSQHYRGCLRDVYIGTYRLPFLSQSKLEEANPNIVNTSYITTTAPTAFYIDERFHHAEEQLPDLGCILCYEKDCRNGGQCTDSTQSYDCSCSPGYEGETCDRDIDECVAHKCEHGSTCVDGINNYTCTCSKGYDGDLCENDIDECEGKGEEKCNYNGECQDDIGEFKCQCFEEYTGIHCDKRKKSNCKDEPCENGATCNEVGIQSNGVSFKCSCGPGWEGEFCSERIDYCKDVSCGEGHCMNTLHGYKCNCFEGFDGIHCDVNIDECSSQPCKNNGKCIDGINSYSCNCTDTGFMGTLCEEDIDECNEWSWHSSQQICHEPLICENFIGSYQCSCPDKLMCGEHCDINNPCYGPENVTCLNGGTCKSECEDRENPRAFCRCLSGYVGSQCEKQAQLQRPADESGIDILLIIIPVLAAILIAATVGIIILVRMARRKRATRGVYSPSQQEYCNPRVELDNVMKPPPEERLI